MKRITLLLTLLAFFFVSNTAFATASVTVESATKLPTEKKTIIEKFKEKINAMAAKQSLKKDSGDISIPGSTKTWLLYWVVGVLAAIVLAFVLPSSLYIISRLLGAATSIAFIIWLIKFFKLID